MASAVATKPELGCLQTIESLNNHPVAPINITQRPNVLIGIMSERNMQHWNKIDEVVIPGKGKPTVGAAKNAPRFVYEYETPMCAGGVSAPATAICDADAATAETQKYLEVGIDKTAERHWTVGVAEFNALCETPNERRAKFLRRKAYEILREINSDLIAGIYAAVDDYPNGVTPVGDTTDSIKVLTSAGNIINSGFAKISGAYRAANYSGSWMNFGGQVLATYFDVKMYQGGSEDMNGLTDPFSRHPFLFDNDLDSILQTTEVGTAGATASHGLTVPEGGFGIAEWYENTGAHEVSTPTRLSTTLDIEVMPGLSVTFDYDLYFDECDKVYKEQIKKHYGYMSIPGTEYCGSTGLIWHWLYDLVFADAQPPV